MPIFRLARDRSRTSARRSSSIPVRAASMAMVMSSAPTMERRTVRVSTRARFAARRCRSASSKSTPRDACSCLAALATQARPSPNNPIGADPQDDDYWANNDYWYDDVSDGTVTAVVTLPIGPKGRKILIEDGKSAAWVIVAPPKFAPGIQPIVTLYDVVREAIRDHNAEGPARRRWQWRDDSKVDYYRDIYPILRRAADTAWVNNTARRGHGYDKQGDFRRRKTGEKLKIDSRLLASDDLAAPDDAKQLQERLLGQRARAHVFSRIRNPLLVPTSKDAVEQASSTYMPPLSGEKGQATKGDFGTWMTILPGQYRKFELWAKGQFVTGKADFPSFDKLDSEGQVEALQRAALEPCVGGAFHPGIEMSWIATKPELYADAFRINSATYGPGDISKYMALPWQADFYACSNNWWPAARPDDVIPEADFDESDKAWLPGQPPVAEGLEGRVRWDRGLGVTTLFRRPWNNPAEAVDDPRDSERRGCDDMVRYWSELGFVVPRATRWTDGRSDEKEIVQVECQRKPYAGMDVRELFHCLLNMEEHRDCLPKVREYVENVLTAAQQVQRSTDAFAWMDNIRPFRYEEGIFEQRMKDIYDDCSDFAFTQESDGIRVPFNVNDPDHNPYFRTRENVVERIRQLTPFNFLDGCWLRNIHRVGPVDDVNAILFSILKEELGDGVTSQNHANIYRDLCHSFGFYPPPVASSAFARDTSFLDAAFDSATFQLGIAEFSGRFYPEIIGMTLWLEWTVLDLHRITQMVEKARLNSHFYRMHIAIDNASSGHGAGILRAVKLYLRQIATEGGDQAVQEHWKRIWNGYVAFSHTFAILIRQVIAVIKKPLTLEERLVDLIRQKQPYAQYNHARRELGGVAINSLFDYPVELLQGLLDEGYIVPGEPDKSRLFKALEFRGGPMYKVFTDDEIKLWHDWCLELGRKQKDPVEDAVVALKDRLSTVDPHLARLVTTDRLKAWQEATSDHRILLWFEIASEEVTAKARAGKIRRNDKAQMQALGRQAIRHMDARFRNWLGWSMIRAATFVAAQQRAAFEGHPIALTDPTSKQTRTVAKWLEQIHDASNAVAPSRAFLRGLANLLKKQKTAELMKPGTPWAYALKTMIPGNDGRRARDTMSAWSRAGYPLPHKIPKGTVKALRLDTSLTEEECHPTGVMIGFGTVH